jgi:hypothetical protein
VPLLVASQTFTGFTLLGRLATLKQRNEAESGSILAAHVFAFSRLRTTDCSDARSIGYLMNEQYQGKLLSAYANRQTFLAHRKNAKGGACDQAPLRVLRFLAAVSLRWGPAPACSPR